MVSEPDRHEHWDLRAALWQRPASQSYGLIKRISKIALLVLLMSGLGWLPGCADAPVRSKSDNATTMAARVDLDTWLDQDLIPYLTEQLGQHPRFKDLPVALLAMRDDKVLVEVDYLTSHIRRRVRNALMQVRNVNLSASPLEGPWENPASMRQLRCHNPHSPKIYIGFDVRPLWNNKQVEVVVQMIDLYEQRPISGFGRIWRGSVTPGQMKALYRTRIDERLRGRREYPFAAHEIDLAAAFLARNVCCLLQAQGIDAVQVPSTGTSVRFNEPQKSGRAKDAGPAVLVFHLIDNYLNQLQEINVIPDNEYATVVLQGEVHRMPGNVYQLWLRAARPTSASATGAMRVSGVESPVYIRFP